jgi:hypothetical protein
MELNKRKQIKHKSKQQKRTTQSAMIGSAFGFGNVYTSVPRFTKSIFPPRMRALLPVSLDMTMLSAGNTAEIFAYAVGINNPYLPFNTTHTFASACLGLGGSVSGFTPIPSGLTPTVVNPPALNFLYGSSSLPYQRLKVNKFKYTVTMQPQGSLDVGQLVVCPLNSLGQWQGTDPSSLATYPLSKAKTCAPNSPAFHNTISGTVDPAQLAGLTHIQWAADTSNYVCANGGSPNSNMILEIMWVDGTNSVLANNLVHRVAFEWDVEMYSLNDSDLPE